MTLTSEINSYNTTINEKIPNWAKGYYKIGTISIVCILLSLPMNLIESSFKQIITDNKQNSLGKKIILQILNNNSTLSNTKIIIEILITYINILYQFIFIKIPDDISTLNLYKSPFYNIESNYSIYNLGLINSGLLFLKSAILDGKGTGSLLFGLRSGNRDDYLTSINILNSIYLAYYSQTVCSNYSSFYEYLNNQAGDNGFDDIETDISSINVEDYLQKYIDSASNISIASSVGLYFTLFQLFDRNRENKTGIIDSVGGGNPFNDDEYLDDEEESNNNDKIENVLKSLRMYGGGQLNGLQKSEKKW